MVYHQEHHSVGTKPINLMEKYVRVKKERNAEDIKDNEVSIRGLQNSMRWSGHGSQKAHLQTV